MTAQLLVLESLAILSPPLVGLGVSLSPDTTPFPQKLVDKVRLGHVEMGDLLNMDNVFTLGHR